MSDTESIRLADISNYYTKKIVEHGNTPKGVDWNGEDGQILRFKQLCKIINTSNHFSINDLGCGYGALNTYLKKNHEEFSYSGFDISKDMIKAAKELNPENHRTRFIESSKPDKTADYTIASGIFNIRLDHPDNEWLTYIKETLHLLNNKSHLGFSFNCLTSYSDADKMRDYLYYTAPCVIFDYCMNKFSHNVTVLHDYGLYEFTILVRK